MHLLSQAKAKQIKAFHQKKIRDESGLFLIEGKKIFFETIKSNWDIEYICVTHSFYDTYKDSLSGFSDRISIGTEDQITQISTLKTNNNVVALVKQPKSSKIPNPKADLWLVLESISDPGNMGTIIRLADWFGLQEVITIGNCVEWFNPKVVSSSMGSFLRINQIKSDYKSLIESGRPAFVADMVGESLYAFSFPEKSILVIGNEANGISDDWLKSKAGTISIPSFGKAESLNAGIATGIILNHYQFGKTR